MVPLVLNHGHIKNQVQHWKYPEWRFDGGFIRKAGCQGHQVTSSLQNMHSIHVRNVLTSGSACVDGLGDDVLVHAFHLKAERANPEHSSWVVQTGDPYPYFRKPKPSGIRISQIDSEQTKVQALGWESHRAIFGGSRALLIACPFFIHSRLHAVAGAEASLGVRGGAIGAYTEVDLGRAGLVKSLQKSGPKKTMALRGGVVSKKIWEGVFGLLFLLLSFARGGGGGGARTSICQGLLSQRLGGWR